MTVEITRFIDFNNAVIADFLDEAEEGDLMKAEARPRVLGADVLYENRSVRKCSQYQSLPEALASL